MQQFLASVERVINFLKDTAATKTVPRACTLLLAETCCRGFHCIGNFIENAPLGEVLFTVASQHRDALMHWCCCWMAGSFDAAGVWTLVCSSLEAMVAHPVLSNDPNLLASW